MAAAPVMDAKWRWLRHAPAVLGVALLVGAIWVVQHEVRHLRLHDVSLALHAIPRRSVLAAACWTVAAYAVLTFYDRLATIYAGHRVSVRRTAFASFCAYALAHNLGFAAVSGAAVRYRLYASWGLSPLQIGKVVGFCSLTYGLGGLVLAGAILLWEPGALPLLGGALPFWLLHLAGAAAWLVVAAYVAWSALFGSVRVRGHVVMLPGWRMAAAQVLLATADVAVTAAIFFALLPQGAHLYGRGLSFVRFLAIYLASYTAGLAASLPGGLGVFDSAMLLGLAPYLPPAEALGAIAVFRLLYYVIPLFVAGGLFSANELLLRGRSLVGGRAGAGAGAEADAAAPVGRRVAALRRWSEPDFAAAAAIGIVMLCGAMLLMLGLVDQDTDIPWIKASYVTLASQYVPSLIGAALMVLAIGLAQRVTLAWVATIVLLLVAAAVETIADNAPPIVVALVFAALLLAPFRHRYYRRARLLSRPLHAGTLVPFAALLASVLWLAAFEPHVRRFAHTSWWQIVLSPSVPNSVRATVALTVAFGLVGLWRLMHPGRVRFLPWTAEEQCRYAELGGLPPATADGLVLGEQAQAGVPFRRAGGVLLALGDPAGTAADRISAIWRLRDLAAQEGRSAAVWRAGVALLTVYGELGLTALPLDEHGLPQSEQRGLGDQRGQGGLGDQRGQGGQGGLGDQRDQRGQGGHARYYLCCMAGRDLSALLPLLPELASAGRCGDLGEHAGP